MVYTTSSSPNTMNYSRDDDEIDLDDEDDNNNTVNSMIGNETIVVSNSDSTSIMNDDETPKPLEVMNNISSLEQVEDSGEVHNTSLPTILSKADKMKLRMRQLKHKMNQARQLNQQAVREEVETSFMSTTTTTTKLSTKTKNKSSAIMNSYANASCATRLIQENNNIDPKLLLQPAYENLSKQQKKQEKDELNQYEINDYHNPEGQYRNYQRNVKSLPKQQQQHHNNDSVSDCRTIYNNDPLDLLTTTTTTSNELQKQRDGAHRISQELHRRYEKRQNKDRKRKQQEIRQELNHTSTSTTASGINLRNQKFNQKIARTYDKTTSEIRHNLERGTAL